MSVSTSTQKPSCKKLVLDTGPLLSLSPLRGLAEVYVTVPSVLEELKDKRAREHFERLGLSAGVKVEVREPDALSLAQVMQMAKKTGDYSVLSHADLSVLALAYLLDLEGKTERLRLATQPNEIPSIELSQNIATTPEKYDVKDSSNIDLSEKQAPIVEDSHDDTTSEMVGEEEEEEEIEIQDEEDTNELSLEEENEPDDGHDEEPLNVTVERIDEFEDSIRPSDTSAPSQDVKESIDTPRIETIVFEDPSDEDDGEGEWITPTNVAIHKSRALDLLPSIDTTDSFTTVSRKSKQRKSCANKDADNSEESGFSEQIYAGCMTADFAMQNVLLHMGLNLISIEGKRIKTVKSWVLRCHACFKICKDSTRKFCPSCGNPTLLRASVTTSADSSHPDKMQVHLKKNFTYRNRGTKFSIPAPKFGSSKTGPGDGLILREDQTDFVRAKKKLDNKKDREEKRLVHNALAKPKENSATSGVAVGSWMDPDWVPEIISVGIGGKGRTLIDPSVGRDGLPVVGYGRKNPNERKRRK